MAANTPPGKEAVRTMIRLYDMAMLFEEPEQKITLIDQDDSVICFNGDAEGLLDYTELESKEIVGIKVDNNTLNIFIK